MLLEEVIQVVQTVLFKNSGFHGPDKVVVDDCLTGFCTRELIHKATYVKNFAECLLKSKT